MERTVKPIADRVALPSRTVRYCDHIGLVSPERSTAAYRLYGPVASAPALRARGFWSKRWA
jgi:DNA-binding transcriptional MerR regulator